MPNLQNTITMAAQFPELLGEFMGAEGPASEEALDGLAARTGIGRWDCAPRCGETAPSSNISCGASVRRGRPSRAHASTTTAPTCVTSGAS